MWFLHLFAVFVTVKGMFAIKVGSEEEDIGKIRQLNAVLEQGMY
ncbi:MAG TPA: hypothetical protein TECP_00824 [Hyphomicrobiaceae bacterium MAG_BT-2024]